MLKRLESRVGQFAFQMGLFAAFAASPTPAFGQPAPIYGGGGGRYFEFSCASGEILVGLSGSAGVLVDNIQAVCARVDSASSFASAAPKGPIFGNNRPQDRYAQCPPGYAVAKALISLNDDYPQVGKIELVCVELVNRSDGGSTTVEIRGSGNLAGYTAGVLGNGAREGDPPEWSGCDNLYATGIRGRAGDNLTAFGLMCGPKPAIASSEPPKTLNKRKRATILAKDPNAFSKTSSIPQEPKTLNKRKRPGTWGTPAPDQQTGGAGGASLNSDGSTGAFTKSNAWTGSTPSSPPVASQPAPQTMAPSPLINGVYATIVSITDSRCMFSGDMRGSGQRDLEINPQPHIQIPLHEYSAVFGGPVNLMVDGTRLFQSTTIPLQFGPVTSPVPASFDGAFSEDGNSFDVRFQAGTDFCRIGGTIHGSRN